MIGYINGRIVERGLEHLTVDVNGVGYELACSGASLEAFFGATEACLWVQTIVREDAISLYGFATQTEKRLFLSLLKVNGVGPKMALKILSSVSLPVLIDMIDSGDVKALSTLPKVGKKTAEQLVLGLRGKLAIGFDEIGGSAAKMSAKTAQALLTRRFLGTRGDVASALLNLGFRPPDVERVVEALPDAIDLEQGVRQGLSALSGQPAQTGQI